MSSRRSWKREPLAIALLLIAGLSVDPHDARAQAVAPATSPDFPRGKISGYIFGDYYYNVTGDPTHNYNSSGADANPAFIDKTNDAGQPKLIGRDLNGTQIRRVYLQHDADLSIKYSTRVRLEADSKSLTSDGKLAFAVRCAYLQVKSVLPRTMLQFGVLSTPIWESTEEFYGYRSVEKTIADFRGLGSSSDIGVMLKGFADENHKVGFNAMIGNGQGNKPETNRYKKAYFGVPLQLVEGLRLEPYVDYEWAPGDSANATYKVFAGYEMKKLALGGEMVDRVTHVTAGRNKEPFGLSFFGRYKAHEKATLFARYDRWQPNTRLANRIDNDLYVAGIDWEPYKDVHVIPNVETAEYRAQGDAVAPSHHDMQARVTFFFKFSKP